MDEGEFGCCGGGVAGVCELAVDCRLFAASVGGSGNGTWALMSDGKPLATYLTSELRISFAWRSRCFASEEEKERLAADQDALSLDADQDALSLDGVTSDLVADLRKRYVVISCSF